MDERVFEINYRHKKDSEDTDRSIISIPKHNPKPDVTISDLVNSIQLLAEQRRIKLNDGAMEELRSTLTDLSQKLAIDLMTDFLYPSIQASFSLNEPIADHDSRTYLDLLLSPDNSFSVVGNILKVNNQKVHHAVKLTEAKIKIFISENGKSEDFIIGSELYNENRIVKISTGLVASVILFEALQICKKSKKEP